MFDCKSIHNLAQSAVLLLEMLRRSQKVYWIAGVWHSWLVILGFLMLALIMWHSANYMTNIWLNYRVVNSLTTCGHNVNLSFQWKIRHNHAKENEYTGLLQLAHIIFYDVSLCHAIFSTSISNPHKACLGYA